MEPMNPVYTQRHRPGRPEYAMLAYIPLGLLVLAALLRSSVAASGPSASVLAVDLLGLAMGALVGWLGGEFAVPQEVPAERHSARRPPSTAQLTHETA